MCNIRKLDLKTNIVSTVLGMPGQCGSRSDGPAMYTNIGWPLASGPQLGIAFFGNDLFFADIGKGSIRKLSSTTGNVTTVCTANRPIALAIDSSGTIFFSEQGAFDVKKCTMAGVVSPVAGGTQAYVDGPAGTAQFLNPCVSYTSAQLHYVLPSASCPHMIFYS